MKRLTTLFLSRRDVKCFVLYVPLLLLLLSHGIGLRAQDRPGSDILSTRISYEANHASLGKVLKDIRGKTKIRFTYNTDVIGRQPAVTVKMADVTLETLLKQVLAGTGLAFMESMGGIVIYEEEKAASGNVGKVGVIISGKVTDQEDHPLSGVSVKALISKDMTVTQADGAFQLLASQDEQISFSRIGMKTLSYTLGKTNKQQLVIKMDTVAQAIHEVVVNGYQKIDPRLFTGAVVKLNAADIIQPGQPTIDKMLQGKVPGLMVLNTSGGVNAKPTLRIRGTSTLLGNAAPLWVVDGIIRPEPVDISNALLNNLVNAASQSNFELVGNAISGVSPYDVESITFLKDAAATSIYGTRAANGVIVVTTKTGKAGPPEISYNAALSFQQRPDYSHLNLMNSSQRVELSRQMQEDGVSFSNLVSGFPETLSYEGLLSALYARNITEAQFYEKVQQMETRNTDWFKLLFRNQFSMSHQLGISGGAGKTTYRASFNYNDNKGAAVEDWRKAYGARITLQTQIGSRLNVFISLDGGYQQGNTYYNSVSPLAYALQTHRGFSPDVFYPIAKSRSATDDETTSIVNVPYNPPLVFNMQNEIAHTFNTSSTTNTNANLSLDYKVLKGLFLHSQSGAVLYNADGMSGFDQLSYAAAAQREWNYGWEAPSIYVAQSSLPAGGIAYITAEKTISYSTRNSLDYNLRLFNGRDQFNATLGSDITSVKREGSFTTQPGYFPERGKTFYPTALGLKNLYSYTLTDGRENGVGWYGTAAYNLMSRYVVYGTLRRDGSNAFGQYTNSRFLPNWVVSGRWDVSSEKWFTTNVVNLLQLRLSYGTQGNVVNAVGPGLIATYGSAGTLDPRTLMPYLRVKSLAYPDLRWEKTYQWNWGTDLALFNSRLTASFNYFTKRSVDVLDQVTIPYEYGMSTMYRNAGVIYNKGWDLGVNLNLVRRKNSAFTVTFTSSQVTNRLSNDASAPSFASLFNGSGHLAGRAASGFYSYKFKGLNHDNGRPEFDKLGKKASTSNPDSLFVYSGQVQPKLTVGVTPSFRYRSFSVSAVFLLSLGSAKRLNSPFVLGSNNNAVPSPYANVPVTYFDRWRKPGDELKTNIPSIQADAFSTQSYFLDVPYAIKATDNTTAYVNVNPLVAYNQSDLRVIRNNYLRCNAANLGYTIPPVWLRRSGLKNLNLGFSVNNVFKIANKQLHGQDPEISDMGSGYSALPMTRSYAFSLNASF